MPPETQVILQLGAATLGALGAAVVLMRSAPVLGPWLGPRGGAARLLWAALGIALASRVAASLELLAVEGITLGVLASAQNLSGLWSELVAGSAPMLVVGYGLLAAFWSRLDWDAAEARGWAPGAAGRFVLFLVAGLWLGWLVRVPLDLATSAINWGDARRMAAVNPEARPYLIALPITMGGMIVAYGWGLLLAGRCRGALARCLAPDSRGTVRVALLAVAAAGLLADGLMLTAYRLTNVLPPTAKIVAPAEFRFALLALAVAYPLAAAGLKAVRTGDLRGAGLVPAGNWWFLLMLTLAAYLAWPVETAARLVSLQALPGMPALAAFALFVAALAFAALATWWYPGAAQTSHVEPDADPEPEMVGE